jgi:hypothetical protein
LEVVKEKEMKSKSIQELETEMAEIVSQMGELKTAVDRYHTLSHKHSALSKEHKTKAYNAELRRLEFTTNYTPPKYPEMGVEGELGSATFKNEEDAKKLVDLLRQPSYYHGYKLVWDGPGDYNVEPDYKHDHDGEVIWLATFKKAE